jgi:hypothetical protein
MKYEIINAPQGTEYQINEKEIKLFIPDEAEWAKTCNDPDKYYIGFKIYAPNDAIMFSEGLTNTLHYFDDDLSGQDNDNKKYNIFWIPAAAYKASTNSWVYYGQNRPIQNLISINWIDKNNNTITEYITVILTRKEE